MPRQPAQQSETVSALYEAVRTPEGLEKFRSLLAKNVPLKTICEEHFNLPYRGPDYTKKLLPEFAQEIETQKSYTKHPMYRLLLGFEITKKEGVIALTADTPEEIWQSDYIKKYFGFYQVDPDDYKADYLKALHHKGIYQLSNLYAIVHCKITYSGRILIILPEPQNGSQ